VDVVSGSSDEAKYGTTKDLDSDKGPFHSLHYIDSVEKLVLTSNNNA
jgi:hypothetical protein